MSKNKIKYPWMRQAILVDLKELSNREYQMKNWVRSNASHFFWDNLRYCIDTFLEEIPFETNPYDQIGYTLYDEEEAEAILNVACGLRNILNKIGIKRPDSEYLDSLIWEEVIQSAARAFFVLNKNKNKLKFLRRRGTLLLYIDYLSNKDLQNEEWVKTNSKSNFWRNLESIINFFLDEIYEPEYIYQHVSYTFYNQEEVKAILSVIASLQKVLDNIGPDKADLEYVNSSEWEEVVGIAQHAQSVLNNDESLARCIIN